MKFFVDTSAFLSVLDRREQNHDRAQQIWRDLVREESSFICTNYVLLETIALVQNRLGMDQLHAFHENVVPFLRIIWVGEELHSAAITAMLTANRRQLSLVDCVSFTAMRQFALNTAFAFDKHFAEQGFQVLT